MAADTLGIGNFPSLSDSPTRDVVVVRGTRTLIFVILFGVFAGSIAAAVSLSFALKLNVNFFDYIEALALGVAVTALFLGALWRDAIREVAVGDSGVRLRTGRETLDIAWASIIPFRYPVFLGEIGVEFKALDSGGRESVRAIIVTPKQARAIALHPRYPKQEVTPYIFRSLKIRDRVQG
jgi:hypothetical protein